MIDRNLIEYKDKLTKYKDRLKAYQSEHQESLESHFITKPFDKEDSLYAALNDEVTNVSMLLMLLEKLENKKTLTSQQWLDMLVLAGHSGLQESLDRVSPHQPKTPVGEGFEAYDFPKSKSILSQLIGLKEHQEVMAMKSGLTKEILQMIKTHDPEVDFALFLKAEIMKANTKSERHTGVRNHLAAKIVAIAGSALSEKERHVEYTKIMIKAWADVSKTGGAESRLVGQLRDIMVTQHKRSGSDFKFFDVNLPQGTFQSEASNYASSLLVQIETAFKNLDYLNPSKPAGVDLIEKEMRTTSRPIEKLANITVIARQRLDKPDEKRTDVTELFYKVIRAGNFDQLRELNQSDWKLTPEIRRNWELKPEKTLDQETKPKPRPRL